MPTTTDTFADRLAASLTSLGLTESLAAKSLGCTPGYLNHLLRGRHVPTLDKIHAIALALEINPAELDSRLASVPKSS